MREYSSGEHQPQKKPRVVMLLAPQAIPVNEPIPEMTPPKNPPNSRPNKKRIPIFIIASRLNRVLAVQSL